MIYLSIVIPVRNEVRFIEATLGALAAQDYPRERFELIVVDGMSTDGTPAKVRDFIERHSELNVQLLTNPGVLSSCARNIGVKASQGRLIGIIDGHVRVPDDQLFRNMELLKEENHALCLARPAPLDVPELKEGMAYWIALARKSWLGHSRNSYIYSDHEGFVDPVSSGFAYDRRVFNWVGYFDESFDAAEDVEFHFRLKRAGIQAYTSPNLLIYSYPRESIKALFRQQVRYGIGRAKLVCKHPQALTKETLIPAFILLLLASLPFALLFHTTHTGVTHVYTAAIIVYIVAVCLTALFQQNARRNPAGLLAMAVAICITHVGLGFGFLDTILRKKNG